jgi:disulfide bond formation protein DsbB
MSARHLLASPRIPALLLILASGGTLLGAFFFQYVVGLAPCALCILQRWPHAAAVALGLGALALARRPGARGAALGLAGLALLAGAGIAAFHVGVEQGWWAGTASCGGAAGAAASVEDLRAQIMAAPVVRCTDVPWSLLGVSMAGYNALISLALAGFALLAARASLDGGKTP